MQATFGQKNFNATMPATCARCSGIRIFCDVHVSITKLLHKQGKLAGVCSSNPLHSNGAFSFQK